MEKFIGTEFMDREGDRVVIYGYDFETETYLGRFTYSTHQFADCELNEVELERELSAQPIREKFYKNVIAL